LCFFCKRYHQRFRAWRRREFLSQYVPIIRKIKDRENENRTLFSVFTPSKTNIIPESKISIIPEVAQKENPFQEIYPRRKR